MKGILFIAFFLVFFCSAFAKCVVDVYGGNSVHSKQILREYATLISEIESELLKLQTDFSLTGKEDIKKIIKIKLKKETLIEEIKKKYALLFVYIHTTKYPDMKDFYTTVEVIEKTTPERLSFVDKKEKLIKKTEKNDLIEKMQEYEELGWKLIDSNQLATEEFACPVFHCTFGFDHPKLKIYLAIFDGGIEKEKSKILNILRSDPNFKHRALAAFLVGHFKNPKEIISILSEYINDNNSLVRNNAIRVMSATMEKAHITHIDVEPFLNLLNSPYGTDRNKALSILANIASDKKIRSLIITKGQKNLLALLRLNQPNNHEWAYIILKKISGKNYNEYDFSSWEHWFSEVEKV